MEEKIKDCLARLGEKYPKNSICITVNFWHFNHSNSDEIKFTLYMETGRNIEIASLDELIRVVEFILSLSTIGEADNA